MIGQLLRHQIVVIAWTSTLLRFSHAVIYTSSVKIVDMVMKEENILNALQTEVANLRNDTALSVFEKFYQHRMQRVKELKNDQHLQGYLKHPNGIYLSIKEFATEYQDLRSALGSQSSPAIQTHLSAIADGNDISGARLSFLRLQATYNMNASEMIRGNYLGSAGPELSNLDALMVGETALAEGRLDFAVQWLQEALTMSRRKEPSIGISSFEDPVPITGRILALLGRTYLRQGLQDKAVEMHKQAEYLDPTDANILNLKHELVSKPLFIDNNDDDKDFQRLCQVQNKLTKSKFDPRLKCFYREAILPYYRFKQELVSVSPYVCLFFDVISDQDSESIINYSKTKLERGRVESKQGVSINKETRTSDLSFIHDEELPIFARMSQRVGAITNLESSMYVRGDSFAAEPFQVVNYGMGGHYTMHVDPHNDFSLSRPNMKTLQTYGGNRLATFLIYLTNVERGGSTVFTRADIAVSPVKKMALFWYSYDPSGKLDTDTVHAGCPVVVGHKWVTNKWIWQYGNTFSRRCGLTPDATQLDIEKHMRKGWA